MFKRLKNLVFALIAVLGFSAAWAVENVAAIGETGYPTLQAAINGTANECVINTIEEFKEFAALTRGAVTELGTSAATTFEGKTVKLGADLTFGENDVYSSFLIKDFAGIFDGNGKTIKGLKFNGSGNYICLFNSLGGTIKNLILDTVTLSGTINWTGGLVGLVRDGATVTGVTVKNLTVTPDSGFNNFGGIASYVYAGATISNCHVDGLTVIGVEGNTIIASNNGGIAGQTFANLTDCTVKNMNITMYEVKQTGGIVGNIRGAATIDNCDVTGFTLNCTNHGGDTMTHNGGVVGIAYEGTSTIKNCEAKTISMTSGGNVGFIGGIVGIDYGTGVTVESCSVDGFTVRGTNDYNHHIGNTMVGGVVGYSNSGYVTIKDTHVANVTYTSNPGVYVAAAEYIGMIEEAGVKNAVIHKDCTASNVTGANRTLLGYDHKNYYMDDSGETYVVKSAVAWTVVDGKETGFGSLQAAVNNADAGATVTLLAGMPLTEMLTIAEGKEITLDLNGKAVTVTKTGDRSLYAFDNQGTLTLTDSSAKGAGSITARGVQNHGTMVMNGGTIVACDTNGGYGVWNYGNFTMNGGMIKATHVGSYSDQYGPTGLGNMSGAMALITGGKFESANVRAYVISSEGTLTITPAEGKTVTVYAPRAVAIDAGVATINGGTFETFDARNSGENGAHVAAEIYYPLYVSGGEVTVTDGAFKAPVVEGEPSHSLMISGAEAEVVLDGGTYNQPARIDNTTTPNLTKADTVELGTPEGFTWEDGTLVKVTNWSQVADTSWYNDTDTEFTLKTAEQLAGFAKLVNGGNTFSKKTVKLGADIDLKNVEWTPVGKSGSAFEGIFDGNDKKIANLFINTPSVQQVGLFGLIKNPCEIRNLTIENAMVTGNSYTGALVGNGYTGKIDGCHVTGEIRVIGFRYVGGLVGYGYANIYNCSVIATTTEKGSVTADPDQFNAGGIIGFRGEGSLVVEGCTVKNMRIESGDSGVGGISGNAHSGNIFRNNAVENVELVADYPGGEAYMGMIAGQNLGSATAYTYIVNNQVASSTASNSGVLYNNSVGSSANTVVGTGVTFDENNKVTGGTFEVAPPASVVSPDFEVTPNDNGSFGLARVLTYPEFFEALKSANYNYDGAGTVVKIAPADLDFFVHGSGVYQTSIKHTSDITIKNVNFTATYPEGDTSKGTELIFTNAGALTLEKCTFANKVGVSTQEASTKLVVRNCAFTGNTGRYALHCVRSPIVEVTGCTFDNVRGGIYLDGSKTSVSVTGNTFTNIIEDKGAVQFGSSTGNPTSITLTGNKMDGSGAFIRQLNEGLLDKLDNQTIAENNTLAGGVFTSDTQFFYAAQINDTKFKTLEAAIAAAGDGAVITLFAGKHTMPGSVVNKNITITGTKDAVVEMLTAVNASGSTINFNGVTVKFDNDNYEGLQHAAKVTYKDCTHIGTQFLYAPTVEFTGCTFEMYDGKTEYAVWTYGAENVTFTDCVFNTNGKAILVYTEGAHEADIALSNCEFKSNGTYTGKAAVELGQSANGAEASYDLTFTDCTADANFSANNTESNLWGNKNDMTTASGGGSSVKIDENVNVMPEPTWIYFADTTWYTSGAQEYTISSAEKLAGLAKLVNEGNKFESIKFYIDADIDLGAHEWTPIGTPSNYFQGNIIGNGHTISNLKIKGGEYAGLIGYMMSGPANYTPGIENLTLKNVDISGVTNGGAFAGGGYTTTRNAGNGGAHTFVNLKLVGDVKIEGTDVGGILGMSWTDYQVAASDIEIDVNDGSYVKGSNCVGGLLCSAPHASVSEIKVNIDVIGSTTVGGVAGVGGWGWSDITYTGTVTLNVAAASETGKYAVATIIPSLAENRYWGSSGSVIEMFNFNDDEAKLQIVRGDEVIGTANGYHSNKVGGAWYSEYRYVDGGVYTQSVSLDDSNYWSLAEALRNAKEGSVITLLDHRMEETVGVAESQNVTIDLNQKQFKGAFVNHGTLTLKNGYGDTTKYKGTGSIRPWNAETPSIVSDGTLVLEEVYLYTADYYDYYNPVSITGGTATIKSGSYTDLTVSGDAVVTVEDGRFVNDYSERKLQLNVLDATLNLNGGTYDVALNVDSTYTAVTKNADLGIAAPEGFLWKDNTTLMSIVVTIAVGETSTEYASLADAFAAVNADKEGTEPLTMTIAAGTFSPTANGQLQINRANVLIQGAGKVLISKAKTAAVGTVIDCAGYSVDNQGGIVINADNVTLKDLTVIASGDNIDAVKVTALEAIPEGSTIRPIKGTVLENVALYSDTKGNGLNLHGVDGATVNNVTANGTKCGISLASAQNVTVTGTEATGAWGSVGMMHEANDPAYPTATSLTLGEDNDLTVAYSENPTQDTLHLTAEQPNLTVAGAGLTVTTAEGVAKPSLPQDYKWDGDKVVAKVYVAQVGETKYETLAAAIAAANESDTIVLVADVEFETTGTEGGSPMAAKSVTIDGQNQYKFIATGAGVGPILVTEGTLTLQNLTIVDKSVSYKEGAWEFGYLEFGGKLVMNNVVAQDPLMFEGSEASFTKCTFTGTNNPYDQYGLWIANGQATVTECTFNGARGLKSHSCYGTKVESLAIEKSVFNVTDKPGVALGDVPDATVTIKESTFNGVKAGDQNQFTFESDTTLDKFTLIRADNTITVTDENAPEAVTAGIYEYDPTAYLNADYTASKNDDGTWTVVEKVYVAQIGETKYESFDSALSVALGKDDTVDLTLLADAAFDGASGDAFSSSSDVTIDLNGKNLAFNEAMYLMSGKLSFDGEGTVVIKEGASLATTSGHYVFNGGKYINESTTTALVTSAGAKGSIAFNAGTYEGKVLDLGKNFGAITKGENVEIAAPEGYEWNAENTLVVDSSVAKVIAPDGTVAKYETLNAAWLAATAMEGNVTVELLQDAEFSLTIDEQMGTAMFYLTNVTLDMNGKSVAVKTNCNVMYGDFLTITGDGNMTFEENGNITVMDAAFDKTNSALVIENGTFVNNTDAQAIIVSMNASLTVRGGTFIGDSMVASSYNSSVIALNGGAFSEATLEIKNNPTVTKAEGVDVPVPEGYEWNEEGKLVVGYQEPVCATIEGQSKMTLSAALAYAKANAGTIITLDEGVTIDLSRWTAVNMDNVAFTIEGNGATITGLKSALIDSATTGGKTVNVRNLTIRSATNAGVNSSHSGVVNAGALFNVVGYCDITLSNVKVVDSQIGGDATYYAGGLIGYVCATAESVLNVVDCSVTGTTLTSTSSVGGLFGHSNGGLTTITGTKVGGNKLKGASAEKEGVLIGTLTSHVGTKIEVVEATKSTGSGTLNVVGRVYTGVTYTGGEYFTNPETASATNENTDILIKDLIEEKDGKYFVVPEVAEVGGMTYGSIQDAINAATEGQTVTLLKDVEESGIKVASDDKIVLDLGSFTLTGDIFSEGDLTVRNGAIVNQAFVSAIESNGEEAKLTLIDAEGAPLSLTSTRHALRIEGGEATINGGTYQTLSKGTEQSTHALNAGGAIATTVTINGGTFLGIKHSPNVVSADSGAAVNAQNNATVTIEDGRFAYGQNHTLATSDTGTIVLKGGCYDQDPTDFCAEGYWAFQNFQEQGLFFVAEKKDPPVAEVTLIDNPTVTVDGVGEVTLESTYKFIAPDLTMDDAKASQYSAWHVDFVVSVDKDIPADSIVLAGNYGNYGWISFTNKDMPVKAGEKVRLLKTIGGGMGNENPYMSYAELCTLVKEFSCGVADIDDALDGVTFTVELQMFPIEPCTSANPSWNKEVADATPITVETTIPTSYVLGANEKGPACATVTVGDTVSEPMTLSAALEFAKNESGDVIVTLTADATLDHWKSVDMSGTKCASLTIDGDGKTIIGLTQPLVMNMPLNPLTVKNLTFKNVAVTGNTSGGMTGAGVITSGTAAAQDITLDGVTVDGGTISSENYAGAFIGYYQGHSTGDLVVNNCAVSNLTITSSTGGSIGAIAGHVDNGTATVANTAIGNVTLNSAEDGAYREDKTGVVFGTVLGAAAQVDATATAHCKVVDNDITKVVGRMNAAASLVINGGEYFTDPTVTNDGSNKDSLTEIVPVTTGETLNVTVEDRIITQEIDGVTKYVVYQEPKVAEFKDAAGTTTKDLSLTAALKLAKANPGSTVTLTANVELPYWDAPVMDGANFTLNGNSKTITGLARPLIASAATGAGNVTIRKLTISGANITGINSTHSGQNNAAAFIGVAGHFDVTLSSCKVVGSTIGGADDYYAGALVGYWCGNGTLTISEATVTDNVIAGNSSVGALVGHSNGGMEIKTSKIGGNAVTTRSDDAAKAGAVIGTITSSADNRIDVTESARGAGNAVNVVGRRYQPVHYTAGTYYSDPREASFTDGAGVAENAVTADGEIVQKGDVWIIAKAKANDEYFLTLSEAIKAVNASEEAMTVTLLTDVSDSARLTINAGKTVVLDLGGHTWTSSGGMVGYGPLTNKGTLTVKNGTIVSTTGGGKIGTITNQGTLTIAADATIKRRHSLANLTFSAIKNTAGAATVYGTLISDGVAVQANGGSVTIADGAKIDAQEYGIDITNKNATVNVTGGEVLGNTTAVQVTKGNLTITGGKFDVKGDDKSFLINCIDKNRADCDVQITGGEFNGFNPYDNAAEGAGTNFCPDGYVGIYNEANGTFMVGKATNWIQVADTSWFDAANPKESYTLTTPHLLAGVAKLVNGGTTFKGVTITLAGDMNLAGLVWPGIGIYKGNSFQGTFDGAGYKVSNMDLSDDSNGNAASEANNYRGFFNQIDHATVKNVTVAGNVWATAPASTEFGGALIAGCANNSTIENCVAEGSANGTHNVAGIVVRVKDSTIVNCVNKADLTGSHTKMGGIAALVQNSETSVLFDGCVNEGTITSTARGEDGVGGIVGWVGYPNTVNIRVQNCENKGTITATETATVGQIAAESWNYGYVFTGNKGLPTTVATGHSAMDGLNYATVDGNVATYVKTLEAGKTYLVTAPNPKPVITLAAGQSITFDQTLAEIDDSGIKAATTLETTTDGDCVTYKAKAYVVTITWPNETTTDEVADGGTFTLAAKELDGMTFIGWSGAYASTAPEAQITVTGDIAITANYLPDALYTEVKGTIEENYKNDNELVDVNDIVNLSLQYPTIEVGKDKNGNQVADVGIKLMKATTLKDETTGKPNWEPVRENEPISANWAEDGETILIRLPADKKAQFFRFIPVNGLTPPPPVVSTPSDLKTELANPETTKVEVSGGDYKESVEVPAGKEVVVKDGTFAPPQWTVAISASANSSVELNGGDYAVSENVQIVNAQQSGSKVTINEGTYKGEWVVWGGANVDVLITGGTFDVWGLVVADDSTNFKTTVTGGTFTLGDGGFDSAQGHDIVITGGTFNMDPSKYVPDTHMATESDGLWTVTAK